jgi:hypothetical protein
MAITLATIITRPTLGDQDTDAGAIASREASIEFSGDASSSEC